MPFPVRNTDLSYGADGCCPIPAVGSTVGDVIIEGRPPIIEGNYFGRHPCGGKHCRHGEFAVVGFPKVLVNGSPLVLTGMPLSRGDVTATGSATVMCLG